MPLSPHLPIYKVQITSLLSIFHRLSELALYGICLFNVGLASCCVFLPEVFNAINAFIPCGVKLAGVALTSLCLAFHVLSSLRYIGWDLNWGFSLRHIHYTGWLALVLTPLLGLIPLISVLRSFMG